MTTRTPDELAFMREVGLPMPWVVKGKVKGAKHDFNATISSFLEAHGRSVKEVLVEVFSSLLKATQDGDTNAARTLLERFCGKEAEQIGLVGGIALVEAVKEARARITVDAPLLPAPPVDDITPSEP